MNDDQLRRKLDLLLGTGPDWLDLYASWAADNHVGSTTELYQDHNIQIFVRQQKEAKQFAGNFKTLDDLANIHGLMKAPGETDAQLKERMRLKLEGTK